MPRSVTTFLMFYGAAEEALNTYVALFKGSSIGRIERYGTGEGEREGSFKRADATIGGLPLIFFDSPLKHDFTFTPAISLFVDCENDAELQQAFDTLSAGGQVLMPLDNYGFSRRFGWLSDRFGVSWQLNLP